MNDNIVQSPARRAPIWALLSLTAGVMLVGVLGGCGNKAAETPAPASAGKSSSDDPKYQAAQEAAKNRRSGSGSAMNQQNPMSQQGH